MKFPDMVKLSRMDIQKAEEVFAKIKAASELPDLFPDGLTFISQESRGILWKRSACELPNAVRTSSLDVQKAEEVFEKMRSASEPPKDVTLSRTCGGVCAKQGTKPGIARGAAAARPPPLPKH